MNKLCVFMGTFNPIHNGHLNLALAIKKKFNFEKIIFIPSFMPPFKKIQKPTPQQRLAMVKIAIGKYPFFSVDDIEFMLPEPSYSIYTIYALYKKYENKFDGKINFIVGIDAFLQIDKWHKTTIIKDLVHFLVLPRDNNSIDINSMIYLKDKNYSFEIIKINKINISSTDIRDKIKNNLDISTLIPNEVKKYIYEHGLYKR